MTATSGRRLQQPGARASKRRETSASILTPAEEAFKKRYAGKKLGLVGGVERPHQVRKLQRLGVEVVWLPLEHGDPGSSHLPAATVNCISQRRVDVLYLFTRAMNHVSCGAVMTLVRKVNRASGRVVLPAVRGRNLNTDCIARMFLAHAPEPTPPAPVRTRGRA